MMMKNTFRENVDIVRAALLGQATGDALGVPVEFMSRRQVRRVNLTEMIGKDTPVPFESRWGDIIPAGAWSDDTSMTVAAMESMIDRGGGIDCEDIMRRFVDWWKGGAYCALSFPFGLGSTVDRAMARFREGYPAAECGPGGVWDNGNGALMRMLPFALYCIFRDCDAEATVNAVNAATAITHGHPISRMGSLIFTLFLKALLTEASVEAAWETARRFDYAAYYDVETRDAYRRLFRDDLAQAGEAFIGETGYVVDSLTAAVYSMLRSESYEAAILCAVNLGYDTDTNAAITGALAGAYYGAQAIPPRWLNALRRRDYLEDVADRFAAALG